MTTSQVPGAPSTPYSRHRTPTAAEAERVVDPFKQERLRLLADPHPCVRVCGRLADVYPITTALLLEKVEPADWDAWLQDVEHARVFERAKRLRVSRLETEARTLALGIFTKRGQPIMLRTMLMEARGVRYPPSGRRRTIDATEDVNPLHRLPHDRVMALAGDEDDEDDES
jgi:hypothetical protein